MTEDVKTAEDLENEVGVTDTALDKAIIIEEFKQLKGVGQSRAEKLIDAGYMSIAAIAIADVRDFMERTGLPKSSAEQLISNARGLAGIGEFEDLDVLAETEEHEDHLTTGSSAVDDLLGGGFPIGTITEIHATNGIGKTQFCFTAAVNATRPIEEGGLDCHVLYVDAENTFSAKRVIQIAQERKLNVSEIAKKIHCVKANNSAHQILLMDKINEEAAKYPVRLLIIDSIISHFRNEYIGRGALAERQQQLNRYLSQLLNFAIENKAVVLVTNQMMASPDGFAFGPPNIAVGGNCLGHACATRIEIRKGQQGKRIIRLEKSPKLPIGECVCAITAAGVVDPGKA